MIEEMEKAYIILLMRINAKVSGGMTKGMATAFIIMRTEINTMGSLKMTKGMEKEHIFV
jgi:hypothetical protein